MAFIAEFKNNIIKMFIFNTNYTNVNKQNTNEIY